MSVPKFYGAVICSPKAALFGAVILGCFSGGWWMASALAGSRGDAGNPSGSVAGRRSVPVSGDETPKTRVTERPEKSVRPKQLPIEVLRAFREEADAFHKEAMRAYEVALERESETNESLALLMGLRREHQEKLGRANGASGLMGEWTTLGREPEERMKRQGFFSDVQSVAGLLKRTDWWLDERLSSVVDGNDKAVRQRFARDLIDRGIHPEGLAGGGEVTEEQMRRIRAELLSRFSNAAKIVDAPEDIFNEDTLLLIGEREQSGLIGPALLRLARPETRTLHDDGIRRSSQFRKEQEETMNRMRKELQ